MVAVVRVLGLPEPSDVSSDALLVTYTLASTAALAEWERPTTATATNAISVSPDNNLTERLVQDFLRNNMAGYKVPKFVTFLDRLPREDSGKLFKRRLRETYLKKKGR